MTLLHRSPGVGVAGAVDLEPIDFEHFVDEPDVGDSEIMNRPRPKKEVKISPIIASSRSPERWLRNNIAPAASPPDRNAPSAKGSPSI